MTLRWEEDEFSGSGYAGAIRVACYGIAPLLGRTRRLRWTLLTSFDRQVEGDADTPEAARFAAEAAWAEWFARAGLAPAPAWRPIETLSPRSEDDTFLVWCPGLSVSGPWVVAYRSNGEWVAAINGVALFPQPTCGMPLPEPPEAPGGEGWCRAKKSADAAGGTR